MLFRYPMRSLLDARGMNETIKVQRNPSNLSTFNSPPRPLVVDSLARDLKNLLRGTELSTIGLYNFISGSKPRVDAPKGAFGDSVVVNNTGDAESSNLRIKSNLVG